MITPKNKNWFGLTPHVTDEYIHWSDSEKDAHTKAEKLRSAYDKIVNAGLEKELNYLLEEAFDCGYDEGYGKNDII